MNHKSFSYQPLDLNIDKDVEISAFQRYPYCVLTFLFLALACYTVAIVTGKIIVPSTDIIDYWIPLWSHMKSTLLNGEIGFWDPTVMNGVASGTHPYSFAFSPEFFAFVISPFQYELYTLSVLYIFHLWMIGVFAYLWIREEVGGEAWVFPAAVLYQLSGATSILGLTSPVVIFSLSYFTILLYLIWTLKKRDAWQNFIFLTLAILCFVLNGHSAIVLWGGLGGIALYLYKYGLPKSLRDFSLRSAPLPVVLLSILVAIFISSIHILPTLVEMMLSAHYGSSHNIINTYISAPSEIIIARLFNPDAFGVHYDYGREVMKIALNNPLYTEHTQNTFPFYTGAFAAVLIVWGLYRMRFPGKLSFWPIAAVVVTLISAKNVFLNASASVALILAPYYHVLCCEILLPPLFAVLLAYSGRSLVKTINETSKNQLIFFGGLLFIIMLILIYITDASIILANNHNQQRGITFASFKIFKYAALAILYVGVVIFAYIKISSRTLERYLLIIFLAFLPAWYLVTVAFRESSLYNNLLSIHSFGIAALATAIIIGCHGVQRKWNETKTFRWLWIGIGILFPLVLWMSGHKLSIFTPFLNFSQGANLSAMGFAQYLIAVFLFVLILLIIRRNQLSGTQFALQMATLAITLQLLVSFQSQQMIICYPLHNPASFQVQNLKKLPMVFEDKTEGTVDKINYRIKGASSVITKNGFFARPLPSDGYHTNIFTQYGFRAYCGIVPLNPKITTHFFESYRANIEGNFGKGVPDVISDERFLDLCSVRYDFSDKNKKFAIRSNAFSRFMLFYDWRVATPSETIKILKEPVHNIYSTLLLAEAPEIASQSSSNQAGDSIRRATHVLTNDARSDTVQISVKTDTPAMLLFNDGFNEGWRATVNGKPVKIIRANFAFMAIPIDAGYSTVIFNFSPPYVHTCKILFFIGISLFVLLVIILIFRGPRQNLKTGNSSLFKLKFVRVWVVSIIIFVVIILIFLNRNSKLSDPESFDSGSFSAKATRENPARPIDNLFSHTNAYWEVNIDTPVSIIFSELGQNPIEVSRYAITASYWDWQRSPVKFEFAGSNDGSKWTVLDEQDGITSWKQTETKYFKIKNPGKFSMYKFIFYKAGAENILRMQNIEFFGAHSELIRFQNKIFQLEQIIKKV
jgi:hypothetical protein